MRLYNDYLRQKYGCKVYRVALDAGFSCPNIESGGCIYCNSKGSRASYINPGDSIRKQLQTRMQYLRDKKNAKKFIAYFQAHTNTYASVDKLKDTYDEAAGIDDIVGISIGTRPDTVDSEKLKLIASYKNRYEVWLEYGLQSIHDKTLKLINRGHTFDDFLKAVKLTKEFDIPVCVHVILGLPGETKEDMMETARSLNASNIDGIKIHVLHVLKGSKLEELYRKGKIKLLEQNEYVELVSEFLGNLSPDIIVQRLTGQGSMEDHIAPLWALDKAGTIGKISISSSRLL
ncbi:MAG: TIGR01212 family radical SAM protein [Omnitrophica bacterium RIFCSPHIGHO2_02_FULL_46_20]|nr:MAG: TIGR01212 family radical SAM protein [Omnitrophica bacterium RIFCSPHIGHO2_02_FULL_46_20]OGW92802.1 MAG: TIGR01212 family radical SAM protein [Omnitrophica bacterium RIFCSPLOWO2_12_FULL_45_13]